MSSIVLALLITVTTLLSGGHSIYAQETSASRGEDMSVRVEVEKKQAPTPKKVHNNTVPSAIRIGPGEAIPTPMNPNTPVNQLNRPNPPNGIPQ